MNVPFTLPKPGVPRQDARGQLERLYREIGISAVASALHMHTLPTPEERERAARAQHDAPAILAEERAA